MFELNPGQEDGMRFIVAIATFFFVLIALGANCIAVWSAFMLGYLVFKLLTFALYAAAVIGVAYLIFRLVGATKVVGRNGSPYSHRLATISASHRR